MWWQSGHQSQVAKLFMGNQFSREMGYTRNEFFRLLPAAVNGRNIEQDSHGVTIDAPPGSVRINVGDQQLRKIASISLPYIAVEFIFENFSADKRTEFMRYFDLRYQRGGG